MSNGIQLGALSTYLHTTTLIRNGQGAMRLDREVLLCPQLHLPSDNVRARVQSISQCSAAAVMALLMAYLIVSLQKDFVLDGIPKIYRGMLGVRGGSRHCTLFVCHRHQGSRLMGLLLSLSHDNAHGLASIVDGLAA